MKIEIEKPVIPQFVADWIESLYDEGGSEYTAIGIMLGFTSKHDKPVHDWFVYNKDTFITAVMFGYEVEKEQKYNVKFKVKSSFGTVGIFLYKEGDEVLAGNNFKVYYPKEDVYRLTEQEIRDFQNGDSLFEHFAVKVEEAE